MSYQPEPDRGPKPSAGGYTRYQHVPVNGRGEFFPEKQGKVSRDAPVLPPSRPNQEKQARRKRRLISIEGQSVIVPVYFLLPLLCILVYVPIGMKASLLSLNDRDSTTLYCPQSDGGKAVKHLVHVFSPFPPGVYTVCVPGEDSEKSSAGGDQKNSTVSVSPQTCDRETHFHSPAPLTLSFFLLRFFCLLLQFWRSASQNVRRILLHFWRKGLNLYTC